jgi:antitoxin ParD1/3/4
MNINLTPELESLVHKKVKSGRYNSASEVVRDALRLFEDHERIREARLQAVRRKIDEGWAEAERGDVIDGIDFFRRLEREEKQPIRKRKSA